MVITNLGTFFLIRFRLYVASTMELFSKNSQRILAVNYFRKKSSIIDVFLGSKYASELYYFGELHEN